MRSNAPSLLPIFRSRHQAEILAEVLGSPGVEFTITELSRKLGVPLATAVREVTRLTDAGILHDRKVGRSRLVTANTKNPAVEHLTKLVVPAFGVPAIIAEHFSPIAGIQQIIIFGSWAARYEGVDGPPPNDIDVLVVCEPSTSQLDLLGAADQASQRIGVDVNPVMASPQRWASPTGDPLLTEIRQAPYVTAWDTPERADAA